MMGKIIPESEVTFEHFSPPLPRIVIVTVILSHVTCHICDNLCIKFKRIRFKLESCVNSLTIGYFILYIYVGMPSENV